jgi:hypothetical protein
MVVLAVSWRNRRNLLFSPAAVQVTPGKVSVFTVGYSTEVIGKSPPFDSQSPISRDREAELHEHYDWPLYWTQFGPASYPLVELVTDMREQNEPDQIGPPEYHLRSLETVRSFNIEARDGSIGNIDDFIVDPSTWKVQYLVVDTSSWLPGRKVLLAPSWIEKIEPANLAVRIDLNRDTIERSPEYDPDAPVDRDFEERLNDHYRRKK